jgi:hypothetical protein
MRISGEREIGSFIVQVEEQKPDAEIKGGWFPFPPEGMTNKIASVFGPEPPSHFSER